MRFTIAREKLQQGLEAIAAAVPSKSTLPILGNVLVEAMPMGIRLSGTDLDIAVVTSVAAEVSEEGAITVPAKKLFEIVRELPPAPIRVSTAGEQRVLIECGKSRFKLYGLPRDDYPTLPTVDGGQTWHVVSGDVQQLIGQTVFAVSTEESRPILNGVLWEVRADSVSMVATNGHRLAKMRLPVRNADIQSLDLIIPPKALEQIRRLFLGDEQLEVTRSENHLIFRSSRTALYTRVIEGPYPNYDQVIPRDNDRAAVVDRNSMASALRRMSVLASEQTHRIRLSFNAGILRLSVQTPDLGEAQDEIPVHFDGDPLDIGFNAMYLLEAMKYIPTDEVRWTLKGAEHAVTLEPEKWDSPAKYLCLVMPLRLMD